MVRLASTNPQTGRELAENDELNRYQSRSHLPLSAKVSADETYVLLVDCALDDEC